MNRMAQEVPLSEVRNDKTMYIMYKEMLAYGRTTYKEMNLYTGEIIRIFFLEQAVPNNIKFYIAPDYIEDADDTFVNHLTPPQRLRVIELFKRQLVVPGLDTIRNYFSFKDYYGIDNHVTNPTRGVLNHIINDLITQFSRDLKIKFSEERANEIVNINFYLEIWQNLASIIMGLRSGTIRGGYRRKLKQTRKNKRGAKKTHKLCSRVK